MLEQIISDIAYNLKKARLARGMKQYEVAKVMKVPATHYNRIELGKVEPMISSLVKAAKALKIEFLELLQPKDISRRPLQDKVQILQALPKEEREPIEKMIDFALERYQMIESQRSREIEKREKELEELRGKGKTKKGK